VEGPRLYRQRRIREALREKRREARQVLGQRGKRIDWIKPYTIVKNTSFDYPDVSIKWFEDGTLNVSANCIDRHLKKRGKQVAIIWEPDDPSAEARHITYRELHKEVCRLA
jgi:acetyl-CoA synthetase